MCHYLHLFKAGFLSPKYLLLRALALGLIFGVVHIAGLRDYSAFLSGTAASVSAGMKLSSFYGMIYIAAYIGCVVVAPILLLAAALLTLWNKLLKNPAA